jgi:hypothetical protein
MATKTVTLYSHSNNAFKVQTRFHGKTIQEIRQEAEAWIAKFYNADDIFFHISK